MLEESKKPTALTKDSYKQGKEVARPLAQVKPPASQQGKRMPATYQPPTTTKAPIEKVLSNQK